MAVDVIHTYVAWKEVYESCGAISHAVWLAHLSVCTEKFSLGGIQPVEGKRTATVTWAFTQALLQSVPSFFSL